jgi:tetratricopeptide (TPR) repeat protein
MMTRKGIAIAAMLLTLAVSTPLMAQRPRNADAAGQRGAPPVDYRPKASSAEEFGAFQALNTETNPTKKIELADTFLTTYPNSQLAGFVQRFRMQAFTMLGKYKEAVAAGEAGLALETKYLENMIAKADADAAAAKSAKDDKKKQDKNAPPPAPPVDKNSDAFKALVDDTEKAMMYYYQNIMTSYQSLNDAAKTVEWGQKALGQNPDDLLTLLTLSSVMAARPPSDEKEMQTQMKDAEGHARKALTQVNTLMSSPMAAQMRPEDKAGLQSSVHQTLGRIYFNQKKYSDAQKEYGAAIVAKKDDGDSYFYLGLALAQDKPPKVDDAMEALAKAVYLKGATAPQANDVLKQLYQNVKKSMDGFDDFVKAAGAKIGQ